MFTPLLSVLVGCARMAPGQVAEGVAQLTVRELGGVLVALNDDATCGFASPALAPMVSGALGEEGTATWTVEGCTIDLGPEPVELMTDCNGSTTRASGRITVSARKVVTGRFTGDPATPVIPTRADAATFHLDEVVFADFLVTKSNSDSSMKIYDGAASAVITPVLAADDDIGACSVSTPNLAFDDIRLGTSRVEVVSGKRRFDVDVAGALLEATNGVVGEHENRVEGTIQVWGHEAFVSLSGPTDGLDPDYDPAAFAASWSCAEGLAQPIRHECPLEPMLVESVARLLVKDVALVTKTVDLDSRCGFDRTSAALDDLLDLGAVIDLLLDDPQTFVLEAEECRVGGERFPIFEDCLGTRYFLDGTATVTGTKTVTGLVDLFADDPMHPQDRHSAVVEIEEVALSEVSPIELADGADEPEPYLTLHDGRLAATYHPVTGEAANTPGAYFIVIPVGEWSGVRLFDGDVTLRSGAMSFPMHVDDSDLYAFTGGYLDDVNRLHGTITVDGTVWEIGSAAQPIPLDPEYDQALFDESYACTENLAEVVQVN